MNLSAKIVLFTLGLFALTACGGGGSLSRDDNGGQNPPPSDAPVFSISLEIVERASGEPSNELNSETPLTIIATVTDEGGAAQDDELVTFTFNIPDLAEFDPASGTALTNAEGIATIDLVVGQTAGAGVVTAQVDSGENAQIGFNSAGVQSSSAQPASLELFASSTQLASSGSDQIELIAVVKNAQNVLMEGIDVSFAANAGAALQLTQPTTAADGTARAMLSTPNNPENRTVSVTAQTGTVNVLSQMLDIDVTGTEVNISGPSSVIINDSAPLTILVADSDGEPIANQPVQLVTGSGLLSNNLPTTGPNGQVTVNYTGANAGADTVTASALNATGSIDISVQADQFSFTTVPSADVPLGTTATLSITWLRDGNPFAGGDVTFSSSRGSIATPTVTTNASGVASVQIQSNNAGIASISAEGVDGSGAVVTARTEVEFIATNAATILVDATPDNIGPDGQTSTITAVVRDVDGNLVKGQTVNFEVNDVSGGFVSPGTATTDSSGIASTVYTSNSVSSEDAVVVRATVASAPSVSDIVTLTVGNRAFDISLGTGREIQLPDPSSYLKEFAVFVSDPAGRPVQSAALTVSATPVAFNQGGEYRKGFWQYDSTIDVWVPIVTAVCANEDINANGRLDVGEDTNGDGQLTPGIVGTISFAGGTDETDANGQATLEYRYPREFGPWTDTVIAVFGQSAGSESQESQTFGLTVAAEDVSDEASPPPANPYGMSASCTDTL